MPSSTGAQITDLLASTAEISNLVSVLSVLAALLVMLVFLIRLIYQVGGSLLSYYCQIFLDWSTIYVNVRVLICIYFRTLQTGEEEE